MMNFWETINKTGVNLGTPYNRMQLNIKLLNTYFKKIPDEIKETESAKNNIDILNEIIRKFGRKPNLCLYGNFDSGKSTLGNVLIGDTILPTKLSPWTRLPSFIHHINDKPLWMKNDVWIFDSKWNPTFWMNEDHCKKHLIKSGEYGILDEFVTHSKKSFLKREKRKEVSESFALIFINSDVLHSCNIIDFPGFGNNDEDTQKAIDNFLTIDVVFYLSTLTGFMNATDMNYLGQIIDKLSYYEEVYPNFPTLGQLFVLATHCDPRRHDLEEFSEVLDIASERIYRYFGDTKFKNVEQIINKHITQKNIHNRMFACWFDRQEKYENFLSDLSQVLKTELPYFWCKKVDAEIELFKKNADYNFSNLINEYQLHLTDLDKLEKSYNELKDKEETRKERVKNNRNSINNRIDEFKSQSSNEFVTFYDDLINQDAIIKIIENKYSERKEAKEYLPGYLIEVLQDKVKSIIEPKSKYICENTKAYIEDYNPTQVSDLSIDLSISFDEVSAFAAGIANLASLGAIASIGIYFGGAWLAANAVGVLATIGTGMAGVGSAILATVGTFLTTITGPIVLGILAIFAIWSIFHDWKKSLSKKIIEEFTNKNVKSTIEKSIKDYWIDTKVAFNSGADEIERQWIDLLERKRKEINERLLSREEIEILLKETENLKSFFIEIPWEK